jgi:hypothetical protein
MVEQSRYGLPVSLVDANDSTSFANIIDGKLAVIPSDYSSSDIVNQYNSGVAASDGSATTLSSYTVGASKKFLLKSVQASSSSGPIKLEVYKDSTLLSTLFLSAFNTSTQVNFDPGFVANATENIVCKAYNNSGQAQTVYTTIMGFVATV